MRNTFAFFVFTATAFGRVPDQRIADITELIEQKPDLLQLTMRAG